MMRAPRVTVIVPAYNAAWCIAHTLQSVQAQTWSDFEAIVIDDGSSDQTSLTVQRFVQSDPRFRLITQSNGGVARARNRGIREARGRYLAPLDADDLWEPSFLERTVEALERAGPDAMFAFARSVWIDETGRLMEQEAVPFPRHVNYRELLLRNAPGNSSSAVFRTAAVRTVGGYDEDLVRRFGCTEDWLMMLRLSWLGRVVPVDAFLVRYRIHQCSASHELRRSSAAMMETIRRVRREGPPLAPPVYWRARSLMAMGLLRRAMKARQFWACLPLFSLVYLANPLALFDPDLRAPFTRRLKQLANRGGPLRAARLGPD